MEQVISSENKPIKLWLNDIEDGALAQAKNLANLPFIFKHIAIMPDSHQGYGMPIGGVMATRGVVVPNAVGVDIGCGMCAVRTSLTRVDPESIKKIFGGSKEYKGGIRSAIPVGRNHHSKKQDERWMPNTGDLSYDFATNGGVDSSVVAQEYNSALKQIGTLGGGNHFIEIQKGSDGHVWIMIHSGSRNIGYRVANHYNDLAVRLNGKWFSSIPKKWELAFLPLDDEDGRRYIAEMQYCVDFALSNRKLMMTVACECFQDVFPDIIFDKMINIAHNYAVMEHHFNKNVLIHRKGATRAYVGEFGIIPGSQGTASYIVKGKGNPDSFKSCSHGAGRKMGRKQAQRELSLEEEKSKLDDLGVVHSVRNARDLDEAPGAYKDIDMVMENQKDLVDIIVKLKPIAVIKG